MDSTDLPVLWLRADKTPDSAWKDVTGHGYDGTFFGVGPRQHVLLNYNPAIWFNGADDSVRIPYNLDSLTEMTYIAVFVPADTSEAAVWGTSGAFLRNTWMTTHRVNGPDSTADTVITSGKIAVMSTVLQSWMRNDSLLPSPTACLLFGAAGQAGVSGVTSSGGAGGTGGGASSVLPFKGALAELLVFDRSLDVLTQVQYETYLAIKYGIPLTQGNYVSAGQTVLWKADKNKNYAWRVTGLGREDYFSLHQKQAVSAIDADSLLVVSNGDPQSSNAANADTLANGNYLVWGDNNKALTLAATPDSQLQLMNRSWLMNVSGAGAHTMATTIRVSKKNLPSSPNGYWLVVNPGGYPGYPVDSLIYHLPDSTSGDTLVYYRRVRWDPDGSGKDLFGLAQARDLLLKLRVLDSPTCANPMLGKVMLSAVGGQSPYFYRVMNSAGQVISSGSFVDSGASVTNLSMGKYSLLLTDVQGHQSLRTLTMVVPQSQYLNIGLGGDQVLPAGGQLYFDASRYVAAGAAEAYQWTGDNGFHATTPVIAVSEPGKYSVVVTSTAGCVFHDSVDVLGNAGQYVAVYPSPSVDGNFTISISLPKAGEVSAGIYDVNGNRVQEMAGHQNTEYRFTGHIATPGVYMINVKTPKGVESHKLLIL
ncbi:hypothetical protein GCM10011511_56230 [Puia dinghuensis]|uniref:T9SS C-terminal target domain-containing protein n=2 Tax=Puia dinghuensis TaxID=1792502 RepID=A0A8J2UJ28_9BACT|nr:hypothetical protein GCM10011511_56230 [Puia dinghuensis]